MSLRGFSGTDLLIQFPGKVMVCRADISVEAIYPGHMKDVLPDESIRCFLMSTGVLWDP